MRTVFTDRSPTTDWGIESKRHGMMHQQIVCRRGNITHSNTYHCNKNYTLIEMALYQWFISTCKVQSSEVLRKKVPTKYAVEYKELRTEHTVSNWEVSKRRDQLSETEKTGSKFLAPAKTDQ